MGKDPEIQHLEIHVLWDSRQVICESFFIWGWYNKAFEAQRGFSTPGYIKGLICNTLHINISEIKYVLCEFILEK